MRNLLIVLGVGAVGYYAYLYYVNYQKASSQVELWAKANLDSILGQGHT